GGHRTGHRAVVPRARAARRRPGGGEDAARADPRRGPRPRRQAPAVHARPDARRRHGLAHLRRPDGRVPVPGRAGLHQPAARRRDQPDAAEDPVGAAGGDGGAPGVGRGDAAPAARPVRRGGDAEPGRVRGHLPAARGAARPLPAQVDRPGARPGRRARASGAAAPGPAAPGGGAGGGHRGGDPGDGARHRADPTMITWRVPVLVALGVLTLPLWRAPWLATLVIILVVLAAAAVDFALAAPLDRVRLSRAGDTVMWLDDTATVRLTVV